MYLASEEEKSKTKKSSQLPRQSTRQALKSLKLKKDMPESDMQTSSDDS